MAIAWSERQGFLDAGATVGCGTCQKIKEGPIRYLVVEWETEDGPIGQAFCSGKCANIAIKRRSEVDA